MITCRKYHVNEGEDQYSLHLWGFLGIPLYWSRRLRAFDPKEVPAIKKLCGLK